MSYQDLGFAEMRRDMRVEEAQRWAENRALLRQAGAVRMSWLARQRCRLLFRLGHVLMVLGGRLQQYGLPESLSLEGQLRSSE